MPAPWSPGDWPSARRMSKAISDAPFYRMEGFHPVAKQLMEDNASSWMARAEAGDDYLAVHRQGPFKPLHDLEQALHFEGYHYRAGASVGSLYNQALAKTGGKPLAIIGGRSAQHRLYGNFAFVEVAVDEALADTGRLDPTILQRAMWAAYGACGMWWPCRDGVVLAERPVAAGMTGDGPSLRWADDFVVGAGEAAATRYAGGRYAPRPGTNRPRYPFHPTPPRSCRAHRHLAQGGGSDAAVRSLSGG